MRKVVRCYTLHCHCEFFPFLKEPCFSLSQFPHQNQFSFSLRFLAVEVFHEGFLYCLHFCAQFFLFFPSSGFRIYFGERALVIINKWRNSHRESSIGNFYKRHNAKISLSYQKRREQIPSETTLQQEIDYPPSKSSWPPRSSFLWQATPFSSGRTRACPQYRTASYSQTKPPQDSRSNSKIHQLLHRGTCRHRETTDFSRWHGSTRTDPPTISRYIITWKKINSQINGPGILESPAVHRRTDQRLA